jgi:hypothetical protein
MNFTPEQLKEYILEAWRKNRLPSRIERIAEAYSYYYARDIGERSIIFIYDKYLVDVFYNKKYIAIYIDEIPEKTKQFLKENPNYMDMIIGKRVLHYREEINKR